MIKKTLLLLLAVPTLVCALPKPQGYVSDFVGVLAADRLVIERRIGHYRQRTGVEVAVVTIQTLNGENLETYATRLFREWGIGNKKTNDGILILIVVNDRKTRIEVGYGLEATLPDSFCSRVIQEDMIPQFKQGKFGNGVNEALTTIFDRIGR